MSSDSVLKLTQKPMVRAQIKKTWALTYLKHAPISLCIREINRLYALYSLLEHSAAHHSIRVLDVGCGDGFWWNIVCDEIPTLKPCGIDISPSEIKRAKKVLD